MNAAPDYIGELALIEMSRIQRAAAPKALTELVTEDAAPGGCEDVATITAEVAILRRGCQP